MGFVGFVGRLLFASLFVLSAWQEFTEFETDGGPAARSLAPKYHVFAKHVTSHTGLRLPHFEMKDAIAVTIALKGLGGLLFIFGGSFGAYLLLLNQAFVILVLCDFYNYKPNTKEFNVLFAKFTQSLAISGALLFFIGMKSSIPSRHPRKKAPKSKTS